MEQLRAELSHLLGEKLSRIECVNEKADTALWALYDSQGNPMPLMARSFSTPGKARQLAWKTTMLARSGTVRMPTIYGVMTHEEHPGPMSCYWSGCVVFRWRHQPEHQNAGNSSKIKSLKPYWPGTVRTVAVASARSTILRKISGPHGTGNMLKCYGPRSISSITPV